MNKNGIRRQTRDINGREIAFLQFGDSPSLLFLHGFGIGSEIWDTCIQYIPDNQSFIMLDLPGYGLNQDVYLQSEETLDMFVSSFISEITTLSYVAGFSFGGILALHLAQKNNTSLKKIICISVPYFTDSSILRAQHVFRTIGSYPWLTELTVKIVKIFPFKQIIFYTQGLGTLFKPQAMNTCMRLFAQKGRADYMFLSLSTYFTPISIKAFTIPLLYIQGEKDGFATHKMAQKICDIPGAGGLTILPNVYHLAPIEKPKELMNALFQLLPRSS